MYQGDLWAITAQHQELVMSSGQLVLSPVTPLDQKQIKLEHATQPTSDTVDVGGSGQSCMKNRCSGPIILEANDQSMAVGVRNITATLAKLAVWANTSLWLSNPVCGS